jgi:hypothetical protein
MTSINKELSKIIFNDNITDFSNYFVDKKINYNFDDNIVFHFATISKSYNIIKFLLSDKKTYNSLNKIKDTLWLLDDEFLNLLNIQNKLKGF